MRHFVLIKTTQYMFKAPNNTKNTHALTHNHYHCWMTTTAATAPWSVCTSKTSRVLVVSRWYTRTGGLLDFYSLWRANPANSTDTTHDTIKTIHTQQSTYTHSRVLCACVLDVCVPLRVTDKNTLTGKIPQHHTQQHKQCWRRTLSEKQTNSISTLFAHSHERRTTLRDAKLTLLSLKGVGAHTTIRIVLHTGRLT